MATFAADSFNVSSYASFRPSSSDPHLLDVITRFHQTGGGELRTAVDLGCGTGQVTRFLSWTFKKVIGVDPSVKMVEEAEAESYLWEHPSKVRFIFSIAEDVTSKVPPQSADLVTAALSFHWFDQTRIWPELARLVKPGGTVAFWGYSSFHIIRHPETTTLIRDWRKSLAPFWEKGTISAAKKYRDIELPTSSLDWDTSSAKRIFFEDLSEENKNLPYHSKDDDLGEEKEYRTDRILTKYLTWGEMDAYFRTSSSVHNYQAQHPEDQDKEDGDVVAKLIESLKEKLPDCQDGVEVYWPLFLVMINALDSLTGRERS